MRIEEWLWANPVLRREWTQVRKPETRLRAAGFWVGLLLLLAVYGAAAWGLSRSERSPWEARTLLLLLCLFDLLAVNIIALGPAATMISREREKRTWQALRLTALHASQLTTGKLVAALRGPVLTLALLLPLFVMALHAARLPAARLPELLAVLLAPAVVVVSASLWLSSRSRHSRMAVTLAYLIATASLWGAVLWPSASLLGWHKMVWYSSPVWQLAILCLDEPSLRPLSHPLLPEWAWFLVECALLSVTLLSWVTRRLRAGEE